MKSSGLLGLLAQYIDEDDDEVSVGVVGTLEYTWNDKKGAEYKRTSKVSGALNLGNLEKLGGCAEQAVPERPLPKPLNFRLDQSEYRLTILSAPRALPAGRTNTLKVSIRASKSSLHEFRVVTKMADGSDITSRPVRLLYYVPSWSQ